jgi:hypothetical protein
MMQAPSCLPATSRVQLDATLIVVPGAPDGPDDQTPCAIRCRPLLVASRRGRSGRRKKKPAETEMSLKIYE